MRAREVTAYVRGVLFVVHGELETSPLGNNAPLLLELTRDFFDTSSHQSRPLSNYPTVLQNTVALSQILLRLHAIAMGWLKKSGASFAPAKRDFYQDLKAATQHIETVSLDPDTTSRPANTQRPSSSSSKTYNFVPFDVADSDLPFLPASEVKARAQSSLPVDASSEPSELWIVVDNIVFDCSEFVFNHPGGQQVIESFRGEDCSWQFWRFP